MLPLEIWKKMIGIGTCESPHILTHSHFSLNRLLLIFIYLFSMQNKPASCKFEIKYNMLSLEQREFSNALNFSKYFKISERKIM